VPRLGRLQFPDPRTPYPDKLRCVTFYLPDDPLWYSVFWGMLDELTFAKNWDTGKTSGLDLAAHWQAVMDAARQNFIQQICAVLPSSAGGADGDENMIRQDPDNPCLLQTSIDGTNWCTFADFSKCIAPSGQPGAGAPQPQPGGPAQCYHLTLNANGKVLVPVVVNDGDTVEITNFSGAGNDGTSAQWFCADGPQFFAGACIGGTEFLSGSDPLPTANHMRLVMDIDGTFHDGIGGPVTVSGGVVNGQVAIQVNDPTLASCTGQYTLDVCVTNNATVNWCHEIDFAFSIQGFNAGDHSGNPLATYTAGIGWQSVLDPINGDTLCDIGISTLPSFHCDLLEVVFDATIVGGGVNGLVFGAASANPAMAAGTNLVQSFAPNVTGTLCQIILYSHYHPPTSLQGSITIKKIRFHGHGTSPFGPSNC